MGGYGLGKGKPYAASKIAKKRLLLSGYAGRAKGLGKLSAALKPMYQKKGQRLAEFPRKRPRGRMRGIFGVPGLGLQVSNCEIIYSKHLKNVNYFSETFV